VATLNFGKISSLKIKSSQLFLKLTAFCSSIFCFVVTNLFWKSPTEQ
jgi:hypothetical protein